MNDDPARARFFIIAIHRLAGAVMVMLGLLVVNRALDWPETVGWVLLAVGLVDVFVAPQILARMWRTPK
jgi:membrane protein YdbS with pleckstrin-like domain